MEDFFDTFNEQSSILCEKLEQLCTTGVKTEVNVDKLTSLCTLDIICGLYQLNNWNQIELSTNSISDLESAMGCKVNAQTEESDYVKAVHRFLSTEAAMKRNF